MSSNTRGFGKPQPVKKGILESQAGESIDRKAFVLLQRLQRTKLEFQISTADASGGHLLVYDEDEGKFVPGYIATHKLNVGAVSDYRFSVTELPINVYLTSQTINSAAGVHVNKTADGTSYHGMTNLIGNQGRWFTGMDANTAAGNADYLLRNLLYGKNLVRMSHLGVSPKVLISHSASGSPSGQTGFMHVRGYQNAAAVLVIEDDTDLGEVGDTSTILLQPVNPSHSRVRLNFNDWFSFDTDSSSSHEADFGLYQSGVEKLFLDTSGKLYLRPDVDIDGHLNAVITANVSGQFHATADANVHGKLGVGHTAASTAHLELGAGTTALAPQKFRSGTNLSATQDGAVEYDGAKLQFTPDTDRRIFSFSSDHKTSTTTVSNTVTRTNLLAGTLSANSVAVGQTYRATVMGHYNTANGTDTFTLTMQVGSTDVMTVTSTAAAVTGSAFIVSFDFTIRSLGAGGTIQAFTDGSINGVDKAKANTTTTSINTTAAMTTEIDLTWSNALSGNTLSATVGFLERLG